MPGTQFMRVLSVVVFIFALIGVMLGLTALGWEIVSDAGFATGGFWIFTASLLFMLLSIIAYQLCRMNETKAPGDEEINLSMMVLSELRAARTAEEIAETPSEPEQKP